MRLRLTYIKYFTISTVLLCSSCKLHETFIGDLTEGQVGGGGTANTGILLQSLYNSMETVFTDPFAYFDLQELCTDEAIAPTRGTDWDDNGVWRSLHQHKWLGNNDQISKCFNSLNGIVFAATDLLRYKPTKQQQAEARYIRAFTMYFILDLFDQVPYRDPGESLLKEARVRKGGDALDYIISEINDIINDLPVAPVYETNRYAAKVLLMKCYLNKGVYLNRADPKPDPADMNKVISLADEIINSGLFSFSTNYFDNFAPDNSNIGKENIFTLLNIPNVTSNNLTFLYWGIVLHYNQNGINGWSTLSDFYDKFEANDQRRGIDYLVPGSLPNPANAINAGFLVGQQYDYATGAPLTDFTGAPLVYTQEVHNIDTGFNFRVTGIRPIKYFPDWANFFTPDNDFVFFRLPDVLLMKAEAILRGGAATASPYGNTATAIINAIRTDPSRGATSLTNATLDDVYDERGRELWWEGWRRQDMIRFKTFLKPFQEKEYEDDPKYLLYPIPDDQMAVNTNYKVNPGY